MVTDYGIGESFFPFFSFYLSPLHSAFCFPFSFVLLVYGSATAGGWQPGAHI
jgi:hypothetical protein